MQVYVDILIDQFEDIWNNMEMCSKFYCTFKVRYADTDLFKYINKHGYKQRSTPVSEQWLANQS